MTRRAPALAALLAAGLAASATQPTAAAAAPAALTVEARPGQVARAVHALGGTGLRVQRRTGAELQVVADPARRTALRRLPGVAAVRPATTGFEDEGMTSEGLARSGAATLKGVADGGRGLVIAVLDMGFGRRLSPLQGSGELPPPDRLEVQSFDPVSGLIGRNAYGNATNHGELVAQTVYDYAPEAEYLFVNYHSVADFVAATDWLVGRRPDIVVHSNSFLEGPFDGTGPAARAVDRAAAAGILWVNSAGNYGQRHWEGEWSDAGDDGDLDWPGGAWTFARGAGQPITFALSWNRSDTGVPADLDLVLERSDGAGGWEAVAASGDRQAVSDPAERITGYLSPIDGLFRLRVVRHSGPAPEGRLTLFSREIALEPIGGSALGSVPTPGDAAGSLTVGAVDWRGDRLKPYSSQGPTDDGRLKPDLTAPTDTRVTGLTVRRAVGGTSIAAPNAAGAAAVLMGARRRAGAPSDAAGVRAELGALALDLGEPGPDVAFGSGRVRLDATPPRLVRPSPRPLSAVRARVPLTVTAVDRSTIARWSVAIDGVPLGRTRSGTPRPVSLDTRRLVDGFHLVRVEARDFPGNTGSAEWYLRVDNRAPAVVLGPAEVTLSPPRPAPRRQARGRARPAPAPPPPPRPVALPLTVSDDGTTGGLRVQVRLSDLGGRPVARRDRVVRAGAAARVTLGRVPRGRYLVRVEARDPAGNRGAATAPVVVPR